MLDRRQVLAGLSSLAVGSLASSQTLGAQGEKLQTTVARSAIVVRSTENITEGSWVWLLKSAKESGIGRIYLLMKQDEDNYRSEVTGRTLRSGELLAPVDGGSVAAGWEDPAWLNEMLARAKEMGTEIHAWWPCFQDAIAGGLFAEARLSSKAEGVFLDPAFTQVQAYQSKLLNSLLDRYPFDGFALDWLRYNSRIDGSHGPLAKAFHDLFGQPWSQDLMAHPHARSVWDDLRAQGIADWAGALMESTRRKHPGVHCSAFLLPWMFKEVAQSYRHLSAAGLDSIQPMIYWRDWNEDFSFTADVLRPAIFQMHGRTTIDPTFDVTDSLEDLTSAAQLLPQDRIGSLTFYNHGVWGAPDFQKVSTLAGRLGRAWKEAGHAYLPAVGEIPKSVRLEPAAFPPDASIWALVCLAELYRRNPPSGKDPVVPVLALHRFCQGGPLAGPSDWHTSTSYLEKLLALISSAFTAVSIEKIAAFMTSEDWGQLPQQPVCVTIDDGSASILTHFEPFAKQVDLPYAVALVTGWVDETARRTIEMDDRLVDAILSWQDVQALQATGRVSFISHSHALHSYVSGGERGDESGPAMTTRLWSEADNSRESEASRLRRVFVDLSASRRALVDHRVGPSTLIVWPYGARDSGAEAEASDAGFTHFFEFGTGGFAAPRIDPRRIVRIAVTRTDEAVDTVFPEDPILGIRWWLAFQSWARRSQSIELIEKALMELPDEQLDHPEAHISRAAILTLRGHMDEAKRRLRALRRIYAHDSSVHGAVDVFEADYKGLV